MRSDNSIGSSDFLSRRLPGRENRGPGGDAAGPPKTIQPIDLKQPAMRTPVADVQISEESRLYAEQGGKRVELTYSRRQSSTAAAPAGSPASAAAGIKGIQPLSAKEVAANVLGFIEQRLAKEKAEGASPERMQELMEMAREGLEAGYGDALEEIDRMGMMTEELKAEIDSGRSQIDQGLEALAQDYGVDYSSLLNSTESPKPKTDAESSKPAADQPDTDKAQTERVVRAEVPAGAEKPAAAAAPIAPVQPAVVQGFGARISIEVTTQEGDVVRIGGEQFNAIQSGLESSPNGALQVGGFDFSVDGDLNETEFKALESMLQKVQGIANQFYSGDFQAAFDSAMAFEADMSQIASYSVTMLGGQGSRSSAAYNDAALTGPYQPLASMAADLRAALIPAAQFEQPENTLQDLITQFVEAGDTDGSASAQRAQFADFTQAVLERLAIR